MYQHPTPPSLEHTAKSPTLAAGCVLQYITHGDYNTQTVEMYVMIPV
jgi:hypothetical protein